jgi:hypothetical protein
VKSQQIQIMSGTLTPNEAREIENREPYEGGDQFVLGLWLEQLLQVLKVENLPTLALMQTTNQVDAMPYEVIMDAEGCDGHAVVKVGEMRLLMAAATPHIKKHWIR